ncbi:rod shape-determining protein RodA [Patescibacteria group bacterium]|nr:rod shape-determining protein RodA [Patescibacteria group bacterium]
MFKRVLNQLGEFDWYLIVNILLLMFFGLATLYSLQMNVAEPDFAALYRQIIFALAGMALFILVSLTNYRFWGDYYKLLLAGIVVILLGVFITGTTIRGIKAWLTFFGQTIQPVEFAKLALVIFLSKFFSLRAKTQPLLKNVFISGTATFILVILVALQPDLGSAMILFFIWLFLVVLLPLPGKKLIGLFIIIALIFTLGWFTMLKPYQHQRILVFLNPQADPLGSGYNVAQAVLAVGSGEVLGRGLSLGSQSQLNFLPEQETDFIFAVIAEELGFVGAGLLLLLFLSLCLRIYQISRKYSDNFGNLLALGILVYLMVQIFINIGMTMGMAPVAGIPLPFISSGGSSLVSILMAMGIVHSIYLHNKRLLFGKK